MVYAWRSMQRNDWVVVYLYISTLYALTGVDSHHSSLRVFLMEIFVGIIFCLYSNTT